MSRSITPEPTPPQTITVSSAAGFNAGDLVYFNGSTGDYGTPTPTTQTSVTVPASAPTALLGGIVGSIGSNVGIYGGCATTGFAATLTDGNIVQVYIEPLNNYPSFRIVDTAGTVVVAETVISSVFAQSGNPNIAVTALTGGGFAVVWINSAGGTSNRPTYAVYSNAGVVVSIPQQDLGGTNVGSAGSPIRVKATPSGGFIIAYYAATGTVINARGYNSTGVAAFGWVNLTGGSPTSGVIGLAVRSDGSFLLSVVFSSSSIVYAIWSSAGAAIVGSTSLTTTNGTFSGSTDAACLSDGTTFVITYSITLTAIGDSVAFKFLPTGNVLGPEFYIPYANTKKTVGLYQYGVNVAALTGNKFILTMIAKVQPYYNLCYAVFDSTGACLSGTSGTTSTAAAPVDMSQAYFQFSQSFVTALETPSGFITLYYVNVSVAKSYGMISSTIDVTTYDLVKVTPTTQVVGSVTGTPTVYAPSGSAPLSAAFGLAAGSYTATPTFGALVKNPEIVSTTSTTNIATTTLPDGRVLVAYGTISNSGNLYVAVYSIAGVLTETLTITTGNGYFSAQQSFSKISISALTSGKFVIAYASSSSGYSIKLYSSTFTQIGSTLTVGIPGSVTSEYTASVSGLTGDRYIVMYSGTSNYATYRVYDNTNTQLVGDTVINSADMKELTVCGFSTGGFFVSGRYTTNIQYSATFTNPSGNTFTSQVAFAQVTGISTPLQNGRAIANSSGFVFMPYANGPTSVNVYGANVTANAGWGVAPQLTGLTTVDGTGVGVNGFGMPVAVSRIGSVLQMYVYGTSVALSTTLVPYTTSNFSQVCLTPSYGYNVGIAYIDVNQKLNYAILCGAYNSTQPVTLTSTDPSTAINIYPGTTSASPAIQNTVFTGVALQTVPAGGAGAVQISGPAQLGSTYPAGTTYRAFDHQGQGVPGVKGTITGRAITLEGT